MTAGIRIRPAEPGGRRRRSSQLGRAVGREPGGWLITTDDWRSAAEERRYLKALRRYEHAAVFVAETADGASSSAGSRSRATSTPRARTSPTSA